MSLYAMGKGKRSGLRRRNDCSPLSIAKLRMPCTEEWRTCIVNKFVYNFFSIRSFCTKETICLFFQSGILNNL